MYNLGLMVSDALLSIQVNYPRFIESRSGQNVPQCLPLLLSFHSISDMFHNKEKNDKTQSDA